MDPEQIAETLQANWTWIGGPVVAVLLIFGRVRSGDWWGAARLALRLYRAFRPLAPSTPGKLRPPISWGDGDNGRKGNGQ